ncbi:MAG: DUF1854 domain-containing protein [Clostridia bacterium]|nr:DUF1854 domain-containing protein [Clostridia bacterium]
MDTENKRISLDEAAGLTYMSPETATFAKKGEFPSLTLRTDEGETTYDRVWLHRVFPFDLAEEFISVQAKDNEEVGIIRNLSDFDESTAELLRTELERKYFTPKIKRIITLKERRGFSYWKVETDIGEMELSFQDTYRSITKIGSDRAVVTDISGNRFEIESLEGLDRRSQKKLELYL